MFNIDKSRYYARYAQCNLSDEFKNLIDQMLSPDPAMRPNYADLIAHPWLASCRLTNEDAAEELRMRKNNKDSN